MIFMKRLAGGAAMTTLALALSVAAAHAQETTGAITGQVTDEGGAAVSGATVTVVHTPTGTRSTSVTSADGNYSARGLRAGGPYQVSVSAPGRDPATRTVAAVGVGDPTEVDLIVFSAGTEVAGVEVTAAVGPTSQGPSTNFNRGDMEALPTISRDLKDTARINPFATIDQTNQDALSFVGTNSRFNQLTVDGIRQNDDFGLNNNGYPTQRSPISIDAVQSLQVSIAPYSVINNGFLGGSINAVTRSGTNDFHGSVYYEYSDQSMRGDRVLTYDTRVGSGTRGEHIYNPITSTFEERNYGATIGGPIIRDRLFFFVSYDYYDSTFFLDEGPIDSGRTSLIPRITDAAIQTFRTATQNTWGGYDPGNWVESTPSITDEKWLARVDWNITDGHRLQITYQNTHGASFNGSVSDLFAGGSSTSSTTPRIGLYSYQYLKDEQLETVTFQLNSNWSDAFSTELRGSYKNTVQNRITFNTDPTIGEITVNVNDLAGVQAGSGTAQIRFGTEINSQPNFLDITVLTSELIGRYRLGEHELMGGFRVEHQDILNIFGRQYLPTYGFNSFADFQARQASSIALTGAVDPLGGTVPATSGTAADGAADFSYSLLSLYAEDTWHVRDNLSVLYGLRYDWFAMDDTPINNPNFASRQGFSNQQNMDGKSILLPRVYVRWNPTDRLNVDVGFGRFSNQGLNVWLSNPFANDGQRVTNVVCPAGPYILTELSDVPAGCTFTPGNGNVNVLDPDLSIANVWKFTASIGYNADLGWAGDNWRFQIDYVHQELRDSLYWRDLRAQQIGVAPDGRPVYGRTNPVGATIGANIFDMMLSNLDDGGQSDSIAFSLAHSWDNGLLEGLSMTASYTFTDANDRNPMTSSIADSSYVRFASWDHQNPPEYTSDYEIRHKIAVNFTYDRTFWGDNHTVVSMFIQSRSGLPFSYTFDASRTGNFDNDFGNLLTQSFSGRQANSNQLLYVPATDANGVVTATSDPRVTYAPGFDLVAWNTYLNNSGLIRHAGSIAPRNGFNWHGVTTIDLHFSQEIPVPVWEGAKVQVYMDIENFGNLLNNRWGLLEQYDFYRGVPVVNVSCTGGLPAVANPTPGNPFVPANTCAGATQYTYSGLRTSGSTTNVDPIRPFTFTNASLWQIKVGVRFRF